MKIGIRYIFILILFLNTPMVFSQDKALEVYMRKNPSKKYIINIDDRVLIKCRPYADKSQKKQYVVARLAAIDGRKFYFSPISSHYSETIYTPSTLREIGIKTTFNKVMTIIHYGWRIHDLIRFKKVAFPRSCTDGLYKRVNIKSIKWRVRTVDI